MTFYILLAVTLVFVVLNLLPIWSHQIWCVRALDFPRMQLSFLLLILLCLQLWLLDPARLWTWALIGLTLFCLLYQGWWIVRYTVFFPTEVKHATGTRRSPRIRIMTANVWTPNRKAKALIDLVWKNRPDVLVTLESDTWWEKQLTVLEQQYPHTVKCPLDNLYGMHVYSRFELRDVHIDFLVADDKPSIHALICMPEGLKIRMHFLHPAPPSPTENETSAERDTELIIVARSIEEARGNVPIIVTGDLNDVAWSRTTRIFRKISGLLDPRIGRGTFSTFHARYPFLRWPLDHLFHSKHFTLASMRRLGGFGSDHFALFTELVYEGNDVDHEPMVEADAEDRAWAQAQKQDGPSKDDVPKPAARGHRYR